MENSSFPVPAHLLRQLQESEARQKLALEAAEIGTFDWDMANQVFLYSDRLAGMFGFTDAKGLKQSDFSDLIHPDDRMLRLRAHQRAVETGRLFYEARFIWKDGSVHWVRLNGKLIYDENNRPIRMYGTTIDITDQRTQAEYLESLVRERTISLQKRNEELQRSEERYHKMVEEVQDYAIILLDKNGLIQNWNRGAEKIKGYTEAEILGKSFTLFYLPDDRANGLPQQLMMEAVHNGRAAHEGWRIRKNGTKFWGSIVITTLYNDNQEVIGFSKVTRDLTERKAADDKLKQYTSELEVKNKELEQFAYIASHDLQEPLRKIQTFSELLKDNLHNHEAMIRYLGKIDSSAQRMTRLIRDVLHYSRLSRTNELFVPVDLNHIIEAVKGDFELLIEQKGAEIRHSGLPVIQAIPLQMNQLFSNLLGNSLKFSKKQPLISITTDYPSSTEIARQPGLDRNVAHIRLTFTDNGIGFEQQYATQLFTIFQRLNNSKAYEGTGIGLALCKKIVENHQGTISAESQPDQGATFRIILPVQHTYSPEKLSHAN